MKSTTTMVFTIIGLGLSFGFASAQSETDQQEIDRLIKNYADARETQDREILKTLFTEDADQLVSTGEWRKGRDVMLGGMVNSSKRNPGDRMLELEQIRFLSPAVAIADARYIIKARGNRQERRMWSTFLFIDQQGWKIAAIRNMLPAQ